MQPTEPTTANTVLLIDGIIMWDPSRSICEEAGGLVVATQHDDFDLPRRAYEVVRKME